jgi:hypothetical protein
VLQSIDKVIYQYFFAFYLFLTVKNFFFICSPFDLVARPKKSWCNAFMKTGRAMQAGFIHAKLAQRSKIFHVFCV